MASKYDEERKKLGLKPVGQASSVSTNSTSKYSKEREAIRSGKSIDTISATYKPKNDPISNAIRIAPVRFTNKLRESSEARKDQETAAKNAEKQRIQTEREQRYASDPPVIRDIHRGLDKFADFVKPVSEIGMSLYTPGAGLSVVAGATQSAGNLVGRMLPGLGKSVAGRATQTALTETIVGAPLGAGQSLAQTGDEQEALKGALWGAGGGAVLGGAGRLVGEGIQAGADSLRRTLAGNLGDTAAALDSVARESLPQTARRTVRADYAPDLFPERFRRTVGTSTRTVEPESTSKYAAEREAIAQAAETPTDRPVIEPDIQQPALKPSQQRASQRVPGERGFMTTLQESVKLTDDVSRGLRESPERTYTPITNVETVTSANQRIAQGLDKAEADLLSKKRYTADDVATGMRLIDEFQKSGNVERAVTVAENLAKHLTEAGQTVQAASIWNRLTPEGALLAAQRKVNQINENLLRGQEPVKLNPEQAQGITDAASAIQAAGASQERAGTVMEIMDRMRKGENISIEDKQTLADFVADAKRFLKPSDGRLPRPARSPKEMSDKRVRDRVTSFLEAQEQAAKERLRAKGVRISSNPIDVWADYAVIGAAKLAKGAIKFADWSEQMIRDMGEEIRPYLRQIYEKAQETLSQSAKRINEQTISKAEKIAESYIKSNEKTLKPEDIEFIRNMAQKVSSLSGKEQQLASQDLQAIMNGFEKAGIGRKISAAQYISMLLNPKTQIRNIVGNELMYRLERLSRIIATPIDITASKITGGPRTVTFKRGPSIWDNFFDSDASKSFISRIFPQTHDYRTALPEGMRAGWRGVSPEGLTTKYEIQGQAFRSKYNPLTYMEKALGATLQGFDYAAYIRAVNQRMSEMAYLDAINSGIKGADNIRAHMQTFMTNMDEAIHNIARDYGKYATLQDDSVLAQKLLGFRRGLNKITTGSKDFGVGSLIVPFAKTPANLLLRGLDYSPAGILKAMKQAYDVLRKPNTDLTRADVIASVSRAIMGTGMGAIAYWMADKGAMFGQSNKDSETRKLQQMVGIRDFQINGSALLRMIEAAATGGNIDEAAKLRPGDTLWSYEWAQPSSMPMAIGSNVYQSVQQKQGALQGTGEAALAGLSTLFNSSVLSGIREAFQIPPGEDNAVKAIAMNLVRQAPSMFTPSFLRNINSFFDEKIRETYTPDELLSIVNYARSGIPGQAQQMPQRVDTLGQPQTRSNSFFDVFVYPSDRSKYKPTPEAQLVLDILNETGDARVAPRAVQKYISGKDIKTGLTRKVDLTPEQYVRLQTVVGQETAKRISKINPNLPTERKIQLVIKAMDEAGKIGRNQLKRELGLRITK